MYFIIDFKSEGHNKKCVYSPRNGQFLGDYLLHYMVQMLANCKWTTDLQVFILCITSSFSCSHLLVIKFPILADLGLAIKFLYHIHAAAFNNLNWSWQKNHYFLPDNYVLPGIPRS